MVLAACKDGTDDTSPVDTDTDDAPTDTDTDNSDTDVSDTDAPPEDFCEFTQCGGDVVGTWNIIGTCIEANSVYELLCPTATAHLTADTTGTWVFDAAGTYTIDGTAAYTIAVTIPVECNAPFTECSQWETVDVPETECTGDVAVACTCTTMYPATPIMDSGTWTYMGEDIRVESDTASLGKGGAFPTVFEVCLEQDRLQLDLKGSPFRVGYTLER